MCPDYCSLFEFPRIVRALRSRCVDTSTSRLLTIPRQSSLECRLRTAASSGPRVVISHQPFHASPLSCTESGHFLLPSHCISFTVFPSHLPLLHKHFVVLQEHLRILPPNRKVHTLFVINEELRRSLDLKATAPPHSGQREWCSGRAFDSESNRGSISVSDAVFCPHCGARSFRMAERSWLASSNSGSLCSKMFR